DVFCLPSLMEGLPLGLFEAMAYERPIVATNVGGTPEVVRDGKEALLVPPRNSEDLAQGLHDALEKDMNTCRQRAKERLETEFDIKSIAEKHLGLYQSLKRD
ncbi:MAG: glycosyltransferase, partial [Candidatus Nanohaloarchaea archaeon]|nr:glycosyltransferase [Candidatus Nanohaloarchaea archaeon]